MLRLLTNRLAGVLSPSSGCLAAAAGPQCPAAAVAAVLVSSATVLSPCTPQSALVPADSGHVRVYQGCIASICSPGIAKQHFTVSCCAHPSTRCPVQNACCGSIMMKTTCQLSSCQPLTCNVENLHLTICMCICVPSCVPVGAARCSFQLQQQ